MTAPARILAADPPWRYDDPLPGPSRGAARHYETMTMPELQAFKLPPIAPEAWLFLWYTTAFKREAELLVDAWGFDPTGAELTWVKTTRDAPFVLDPLARLGGGASGGFANLAFGMGRTVRNCDERCIIARRGRPRPASRSVRSVFFAPQPRHPTSGKIWHSAKPDRFYQLAEELAGEGPRVELFARTARPGWQALGLEAPL